MIPDPLFLGVDLGTSALKCGLFDQAGNCAAGARVAYPTREWEGGAEQQCGDWWEALSGAVHLVAAGIDRKRIVAIGVGGHAPSPAFVDVDLQPVSPVLPWFDDRRARERDRLLETLGRFPASGGERLMVQVAARAMWLRGTSPREFAGAACVLHSGDYLVARLTDQKVMTSPKMPEVFVAADLPTGLLSARECLPGEIVGRIRADLAAEWKLDPAVEVVAGGLDSFLASVGSGIREPGDACLNCGSNSVVALLTRESHDARFEWHELSLLSRPTWPGGRVLQLTRTLADLDDAFDDAILEAASLQPPLAIERLLPELLGSGGRENRKIRKQISHYLQGHTAVEVLRLLLDAIFLGQRMMLEELEQQGEPARRVYSVGGLAAYPVVNQLQADVLGRAIEIPRSTDSGARGAAHAGLHGLGALHGLRFDLARRTAKPWLRSAAGERGGL